MAGHRTVLHLGGTLGDEHHVGDPPTPLSGAPARLADGPAGPQATGQLTAQPAASLHVDSLVDRLVADPHLLIVGELGRKPRGDLLRTPMLLALKLVLHESP